MEMSGRKLRVSQVAKDNCRQKKKNCMIVSTSEVEVPNIGWHEKSTQLSQDLDLQQFTARAHDVRRTWFQSFNKGLTVLIVEHSKHLCMCTRADRALIAQKPGDMTTGQ